MIEQSNPNAWREPIRRQREQMASETIYANAEKSFDFIVDGTYGVSVVTGSGDVQTLTPDANGRVSVTTQHGAFEFEFMQSGAVAASFRPGVSVEPAPVQPRWTVEELLQQVFGDGDD